MDYHPHHICPADAPSLTRLKTLSNDVRQRISIIGNLFVFESLVKPYVVAIDSTLLRSKGHVFWHASSMKEGIISCSAGIDTDAR